MCQSSSARYRRVVACVDVGPDHGMTFRSREQEDDASRAFVPESQCAEGLRILGSATMLCGSWDSCDTVDHTSARLDHSLLAEVGTLHVRAGLAVQ